MNCTQSVPIVGNLQQLSLNRGTTRYYRARRINYSGDPILTKAKGVYFIVKKSWKDETALITKTINDMTFDEQGYYHFSITPDDTEKIPYGTYVWDFTAVGNGEQYRAKPAHGVFIIGNSAGWIVNEDEES